MKSERGFWVSWMTEPSQVNAIGFVAGSCESGIEVWLLWVSFSSLLPLKSAPKKVCFAAVLGKE